MAQRRIQSFFIPSSKLLEGRLIFNYSSSIIDKHAAFVHRCSAAASVLATTATSDDREISLAEPVGDSECSFQELSVN